MSTEDTPPAFDGGTPTPATGGGTPSDDSTGTPGSGARHRRTPLVVTSVAAAVLLVGGGAAYWASTAPGGGGGAAGASKKGPPPLALDGYGQRDQRDSTRPGIAPGEPNPQSVTYKAVGDLPDGPASAPVYRPKGQISQETVERLAKALDVPGKVRSEGAVWKVGGTPDGRGPVLQVTKTGTGAWTYARYGGPGGTGCVPPSAPGGAGSADDPVSAEAPAKDGASSADASSAPAGSRPECPSARGGWQETQDDDGSGKDAVSPQKAKQVVRPVLAALGQQDAKLDAGGLSGAVRIVSADPVLGGLPTYGWRSDLQVGSDGLVVGGSGQLARPVKGDRYPVLDAKATLGQLNKTGGTGGRVEIGGCASAAPYKNGEDARTAPCEGTAPQQSRPRKPLEVTGAVFGLAVQYTGGGQVLVPSWLFTVHPAGAGDGPNSTTTVTHPRSTPSSSWADAVTTSIRRLLRRAGAAGRPASRGRWTWTPTRSARTAGRWSCGSGAGCAARSPRPPSSPART
ncbi:hypothetical protein [Streptomyces sp. MST-110588]|uniref:hypothetical protein n=1 Tax=Streptomyces sp. MST-110588 TaxID=2833628 RepID=UPI003242E4B3